MSFFFKNGICFFVMFQDFGLDFFRDNFSFFFDLFDRCYDASEIDRCFAHRLHRFVLRIDLIWDTFDSFLIGFHNSCFCNRLNLYLGWFFPKQAKKTFLFTRYNRNMCLHTGNI